MLNRDGNFKTLTPSIESVLGYEAGELIGENVNEEERD